MRTRPWRYAISGFAVAGVTAGTTVAYSSPDNRHILCLPEGAKSLADQISNRRTSWSSFFSASVSSSSSSLQLLAASPVFPKPSENDFGGGEQTPVQKWDDNWDLRDPEFLGLTEYPKAFRHLILIRHGQYFMDSDDDADRKLTELGRKQLRLTGNRLKELSGQSNVRYDKILVSSMTRAMESADIIAEALPDVPRELPGDALLREGAPYPPEPPNWNVTKSQEQTAKKLQNYYVDGPRIESAFRKYFRRASYEQKEDSTEIIVCHANVIRYFAMRALQLPPEAWLRISLKNGSITFISISPRGKVALRAMGDDGHMPPDCLTTT